MRLTTEERGRVLGVERYRLVFGGRSSSRRLIGRGSSKGGEKFGYIGASGTTTRPGMDVVLT